MYVICATDTCFAAVSDDLHCGHYLHQEMGMYLKDDSYSQFTMKYSNVITYRKKELVVLLTELQGNYNQNRKLMMVVAKHSIAHFCCFSPNLLYRCAFMLFSYIGSMTYPARESI